MASLVPPRQIVIALDQDDPGQVVAALHRLRAVLPRGSVELTGPHHIRQQLRLAEASAGGFRLLEPAR